MRRLHLLESRSYAAGNLPFSLQNLPKGKKIEALRIRADLVITTGAAAALIAGSQLFRLFQTVRLGRLIDTSGLDLHMLSWLQKGREDYLPASIPATNAKPFQRVIQVDVPWRDPRSAAPDDQPPQVEESSGQALQVQIPAFASLGAGTWDTLAGITGTVEVYAILGDNAKRTVAPKVRIGAVDVANQTITLPPGAYEYVYILNQDGTGVTNAEITSLAVKADGEVYSDPLTLPEHVETFNMEHAAMGSVRADSATAPVAGARLTALPSVAADATNAVTTETVPVIIKPAGGKLSQVVIAQQGVEIKAAGTKTSFHVAFKMLEAHSESDLLGSFQRMGLPVRSLAQVDNDTANGKKRPARANKLAPFLPVKTADAE